MGGKRRTRVPNKHVQDFKAGKVSLFHCVIAMVGEDELWQCLHLYDTDPDAVQKLKPSQVKEQLASMADEVFKIARRLTQLEKHRLSDFRQIDSLAQTLVEASGSIRDIRNGVVGGHLQRTGNMLMADLIRQLRDCGLTTGDAADLILTSDQHFHRDPPCPNQQSRYSRVVGLKTGRDSLIRSLKSLVKSSK